MTRRKWINLILLFILITISLTSDWSCEDPYPIDKPFPTAELLEDLSEVQRIIEDNHPALRYYNFSNRFLKTADSLRSVIDSPKTVMEFYVDLNLLIEKVNCGHTTADLPDFYWNAVTRRFKHFPFKLYFIGRKAFCLRNFSEDSSIVPGSEIITINNIPVTEIISSFLKQTSSDGFNKTYKYAKMNRKHHGLFPGYPHFPDSYQIEFISAGDSAKHLVKAAARSQSEIYKAVSGKNQYYGQYNFKLLTGSGAALLTISDFVPNSEKDYKVFLKRSFEKIISNDIKNLVLDLRGNDGGDPYNGNALLAYLMLRPYRYFSDQAYGYDQLKEVLKPNKNKFDGRLYILMDGFSFSTSGHVLSILKDNNRGTFIGEESGGSFRCFGCYSDYTLPNTKIVLNYSRCVFAAQVSSIDPGRGIFPDHQITPNISDLTAGKDTVLNYTLDLIKQK